MVSLYFPKELQVFLKVIAIEFTGIHGIIPVSETVISSCKNVIQGWK